MYIRYVTYTVDTRQWRSAVILEAGPCPGSWALLTKRARAHRPHLRPGVRHRRVLRLEGATTHQRSCH